MNMKYILEFSDAADTRLKDAFTESIESESPIPIPRTGAFVVIEDYYLQVVRCLHLFSTDDKSHVQCFCRIASEQELRAECQQAIRQDNTA
jgi:hypothetical protein